MEKLPPDLQYMDENKQRESDPDIRRMLLDALLQVGEGMFCTKCKFVNLKLANLHLKWTTSFAQTT